MKIIYLLLLFITFEISANDKDYIEWKPIDGANGYRIEIRDNSKRKIVDENTKLNHYLVKIPKGKYEFRISPLNLFEKPTVWSYWKALKVIISRNPVVENKTFRLTPEEASRTIIFIGKNFLYDMKVKIYSSKKEITVVEKILIDSEKFKIKLQKNDIQEGIYSILLENPNNKITLLKNALIIKEKDKSQEKNKIADDKTDDTPPDETKDTSDTIDKDETPNGETDNLENKDLSSDKFKDQAEEERLAIKQTEKDRLEEQERLAKEQAEQERLAKEQAEQELLAKEQAEKERLAKEQAEKERLAKVQAEKERLAKEQAEKDRLVKEQAEKDRLVKEQAEKDRLAKVQAEKDRLAKVQVEKDRLAKEQVEKDRLVKEQAEKDRLAKVQAEKKPIAKEKILNENIAKLDAPSIYLLSEKELDDILLQTSKGCGISDLPSVLIDKCFKDYVEMNLSNRSKEDLFNYIKIKSDNYSSRIFAYKYFAQNCKPKFKAVLESMQNKLKSNEIDIDEKNVIKTSIEKMKSCN
jgi:hypothetical protein